jgi:23S rRNA pseudouridine1911/1915/1917 synthase
MSQPDTPFVLRVEPSRAGERLDSFVASEIENCSRSFASSLIRQGKIIVDGCKKKPGYTLKSGEMISGTIVQSETPDFQPEAIPLEILYEDSELIVVNKMPGMVVHPAPGHSGGTLVNALMYHCPDLKGISGNLRPGIVHRLDKDTSGALVAAKSSRAMNHLAAQFKNRKISKQYLALVYGVPKESSGTIDLPIGRHPTDRKKMSVISRTSREALTHWCIREIFTGACLLELDIRTGRTHQIRVHCLSMGHPVIGDPVYSNRGALKQLAQVSRPMKQAAESVCRQMLHARLLRFVHPANDEWITIKAPLPEDMSDLISGIREISG